MTKTLLRLHVTNKCHSQDLNPSSLAPECTLLIPILIVSLPRTYNNRIKIANQNGLLLEKMMQVLKV